jgi:DNA repair exonuclease SbcCD ATPase subunit
VLVDLSRAAADHDLDARASILATQREALADRLAELPAPRRRLGRMHDPYPVERANLQSPVQSADRELDATLSQRERLARELGDPAEIGAERESLEQALRALRREQSRPRDQLTERELAQPRAWVRESFGEPPTDPQARRTWEHGAREVARYRLEYELGDSHDPVGPRPEGDEQRRHWEQAREALAQSQRVLEREVTSERDLGWEIGF